MKKILIITAFISMAFLVQNPTQASPISNINPVKFDPSTISIDHPVGPIQVKLNHTTEITPQEGDTFYLCTKGEVDLLMSKENGEQITFTGLGKSPYKDGGILGIGSKDNNKPILIKNDNHTAKFENTVVWMLFTAPQLDMIFDTNGDSDTYVEFVAANSESKPCTQEKAAIDSYSVHAQGLALHVKEIVEAQPEAAAPVIPPEVPNNNNGAADVAPQSGGCNMNAMAGGFNYAFSSFFALILGAHAILRFRKK